MWYRNQKWYSKPFWASENHRHSVLWTTWSTPLGRWCVRSSTAPRDDSFRCCPKRCITIVYYAMEINEQDKIWLLCFYCFFFSISIIWQYQTWQFLLIFKTWNQHSPINERKTATTNKHYKVKCSTITAPVFHYKNPKSLYTDNAVLILKFEEGESEICRRYATMSAALIRLSFKSSYLDLECLLLLLSHY